MKTLTGFLSADCALMAANSMSVQRMFFIKFKLSQQLADHVTVNVGEAALDAVVVEGEAFVVHS